MKFAIKMREYDDYEDDIQTARMSKESKRQKKSMTVAVGLFTRSLGGAECDRGKTPAKKSPVEKQKYNKAQGPGLDENSKPNEKGGFEQI